ncbi:hypothetical protein DM02DRAFT_669246 [Periconia macrospinosa]|uniref:Uncharacterized protein n=1 Tax=Periconia macrospinosa TaxID=97972 RepID=A0A2V1E4C7_9PLEO|nr:hypothetical protein DM02DRAFT_669246 [Periconia macrospinosa]
MAPRRPSSNRSRARRNPNSSARGVQKRKKTVKDDGLLGPGRKKTWRLPWLKRLAVLRLCGLQFSEIFEILSILSRNSTPRVERTAQHNMRELFGTGWKELCASDRATLKRRLQFILASEKLRAARKGTNNSGMPIQSYGEPQTPSVTPINLQISSPPPYWNTKDNAEISTPHTEQYTDSGKVLPSLSLPPDLNLSHTDMEIRTEYQTASYSSESRYGVPPVHIATPVQTRNSARDSDPFANLFEHNNLLSVESQTLILDTIHAPTPLSATLMFHSRRPQTQDREEASFHTPGNQQFPLIDASSPFLGTGIDAFVSVMDDQSIQNGNNTTFTENFFVPKDDTRVSKSSQMSKISEILRRLGRSRSERSLVKRALSLRYSLSSLNTSLRQSLSSIFITSDEEAGASVQRLRETEDERTIPLAPPTALLLQDFRESIISNNRKLFEECCSRNSDVQQGCIHKQINNCVNNPIVRLSTGISSDDISVDGSGRNALFFAASVGAPLHVLLTLIQALPTRISALDSGGRTFIFYLDHRSLLGSFDFGFLMRILFNLTFDFSHRDHQGNNFLDWFSMSSSFPMDWVMDLARNDQIMFKRTIERLGRSTYPDNLSFPDRLSSERFELLGQKFSWKLSQFSFYPGGQTQVHGMMERKRQNSNKDIDILHLVQALHKDGANMDCQSDCGTTPLIFAAKYSFSRTVKFLLSIGVDYLATDNTGRSALEYTLDNFNASRNSKTPAGPLAESLISLMQFADHKPELSPIITSAMEFYQNV